ncbi:receptor-like protein EIX2 [Humulus lupulus]|uniref:receptor-like protein EIX2 n=1 Tax=Humulus lupulus TaxID=3486 RepID=UPI002B41649A|nr:receptor-like protein EIX2 [Humulus lupulus]XP_062076467.1 receptor-like protein EIX2 [Humulus lupulus]XP_062076468.1 receptor-like protein EIX2 [Humulus lupulus]
MQTTNFLTTFYALIIMMKIVGLMLLIGLANVASSESNQPQCIHKEKEALLSFKQTLNDPNNVLSSWTDSSKSQNYCAWSNITCDSQTNHVIAIDLSYQSLNVIGGHSEVGSSLAELKHLNHLQLVGMNIIRIPKFVFSLKELTYLDLSGNPISGLIPPHLGNLTKLEFLNLSSTSKMTVDNLEWLSQLTSLRTFRLSNCLFHKVDTSSLSHTNYSFKFLESLHLIENSIHPTIITWLLNSSFLLQELSLVNNTINGPFPNSFKHMKSLENVDLSGTQIESEVLESLGNLTKLKSLGLSYNNLSGTFHDLLENLAGSTKNSLERLDLSFNQLGELNLDDFEITFPSLIYLSLRNNQLEGYFPNRLKIFPSLQILSLDNNKITGLLPDLSSMPNLTNVTLSNNKFVGASSQSIGKLDYLEALDISSNSLSGNISEVNLQCPRLKALDLSYNPAMGLKFNSNWVPSFQLTSIRMISCKLGPYFPSWLKTQTLVSYLDISSSNISGPVPSWFINITSNLNYLNMSFNLLNSTLPNFLPPKITRLPPYGRSDPINPYGRSDPINRYHVIDHGKLIVDLSFNQFEGSVPRSLSSTANELYLSNNNFTDLRSFLCDAETGFRPILIIDLSHNKLSGNISHCRVSFDHLCILNLEYNKLFGEIPSSIQMNNTVTLHLGHNNFSGSLPSSLENCTSLQVLDLSSNSLEGPIPSWIGEKLNKLVFLSLKSNKFNGSIPLNLCHLTQIQIFDLSLNDLSGAIPHCIKNFTAMAQGDKYLNSTLTSYVYVSSDRRGRPNAMDAALKSRPYVLDVSSCHIYVLDVSSYELWYMNYASVTWKGVEYRYDKLLGLLRIIDLSSNKLNGEIPAELTDLSQMVQLNLSRNNLRGGIPINIGKLTKLLVLDLSHNKIHGKIPISLAEIDFLSYMDLSDNRLSGKIPTGTQLQSFDPSVYAMNLGLCGLPLSKTCQRDDNNEGDDDDEDDGGELWIDLPWFYMGIGVGFAIGFCGVCGNLLINASWRMSYYRMMHRFGDLLYVMIIVKWNLLKRKLARH